MNAQPMPGGSGSSVRLFVAIGVPEMVREEVGEALAPLRSLGPDVRWTDPAGWHLTVAFLGNTDVALVEPLTAGLRRATSGFTPFSVRLRSSAARAHRSGVLWIELAPSEPLSMVAAAVRTVLHTLGVPGEDRDFRPHLTLARARARLSIPRSLADAYSGPASTWTVPGLELVRSHLGRTGARYEAVATFPFQADV
ncbi:MAG: RNA 2',3'-cyclic phosphodiesterase [Egibacteraceae bacterium]